MKFTRKSIVRKRFLGRKIDIVKANGNKKTLLSNDEQGLKVARDLNPLYPGFMMF